MGASRWILFTTIIVDARNREPETTCFVGFYLNWWHVLTSVLGHLQVTRYISMEDAIQCKSWHQIYGTNKYFICYIFQYFCNICITYGYYFQDEWQDLVEKLLPYIWCHDLHCIASSIDMYLVSWRWSKTDAETCCQLE
jgi:hypothetical protein